MFKLVQLGPHCRSPLPGHVHYEPRTVRKRMVGIELKCLLPMIIFMLWPLSSKLRRQNEIIVICVIVNPQHVTMMSSLHFHPWSEVRGALWLHNKKTTPSKFYIQQKYSLGSYMSFLLISTFYHVFFIYTYLHLTMRVKMLQNGHCVPHLFETMSVLRCWFLLWITWMELRQQNTYTDFDFEFLMMFSRYLTWNEILN